MQRNLDGVYFRIKNEKGKYDNVCFSDLTEEQMEEVMKDRDTEWLKALCKILGKALKEIGNTFDIMGS